MNVWQQWKFQLMLRVEFNVIFVHKNLHIKEYSDKNNLQDISYGQPTQMSFDNFKKCLSKLPKSVKISFSGYTEPFLNPNCSKMIVYAHEQNFPVEVCSTLVGMKEERY